MYLISTERLTTHLLIRLRQRRNALAPAMGKATLHLMAAVTQPRLPQCLPDHAHWIYQEPP